MNQYKYAFLLLVVMNLGACKKDFLNVKDDSFITRQDYVTDITTTKQFLNGVYAKLTMDFYSGYNQIYPELIADNIKILSATSTYLNPHYYWTQSVQNNNMDNFWKAGYQLAASCKFVMDKADEYRDQNVELATDMKGQALTIRALIHFVMVNVFAQSYNFTIDASHPGIPYSETYDWTESISRLSVAQVYTQLILDLNNAIQILPAKPATVTATNKTLAMNINAAKALLARVYLYKGDYEAAKNYATQVISSIPLMAASATGYPSKLFTLQETEALFQLSPSWENVAGGTYSAYLMGVYMASPLQQFLATADIAALLNENPQDSRKAWVSLQSANTWKVAKYPSNVVSSFPVGTQAYYQTLIRSSEMYLTASESYAIIGKEDSARIYLDAIRKRANPLAITSSATGTALLDSIYKERRKELCFEGLRMFDLLRCKKGVTRSDAWNNASKILTYPSNNAIAPIPQNDVTIAGISQNLGY